MKSIVFFAAVAGLVAAQNFEGVPECAQTCLRNAISEAGCRLEDTACQCNPVTQARLAGSAGPCILSACTGDQVTQAQAAAAAICAAQIASSASEAASSAAASRTGTPTSTGSASETASDASETSGTETSTETVTETATDSETSATDEASTTEDSSSSEETESATETESQAATTTSSDSGAMGPGPTIGALAAVLAAVVAL